MSGEAESHRASMSGRKKSVSETQVTSVLEGGAVPAYTREYDADEQVLAALGYKSEFRREFSLWTSFCVSFAVLGLLPSFASTLYYVSSRARAVNEIGGLTWLARGWATQEHREWFGVG